MSGSETKSGYPFEIEVAVAFRDIDAMGHVNNAVFFSYLETARIQYVTKLFAAYDIMSLDVPLILVEATCTYRKPAMFGETLTVGIGVSRFGTKSFDLVYGVLGENGRLVATGKTIQVMYDYTTDSAFPIPDEIREQTLAFQGEWSANV